MASVKSRDRTNHADKVGYKDWARFRFMANALRIELGESLSQVSLRITEQPGWLSAAMNYRWQVSEDLLRRTEDLARKHGIPTDPPTNADGLIITRMDKVQEAMEKEERSELSPATEEEQLEFRRMVGHLKKRGILVRDIATEWAGYGNPTSIYHALKASTTLGKYEQLKNKFTARYGERTYNDVINGGSGFPSPEPKVEAPPAPKKTVSDQDSFPVVRRDLERIVERINALSAGLPKGARAAIEDSVTTFIQTAISELEAQ